MLRNFALLCIQNTSGTIKKNMQYEEYFEEFEYAQEEKTEGLHNAFYQ